MILCTYEHPRPRFKDYNHLLDDHVAIIGLDLEYAEEGGISEQTLPHSPVCMSAKAKLFSSSHASRSRTQEPTLQLRTHAEDAPWKHIRDSRSGREGHML